MNFEENVKSFLFRCSEMYFGLTNLILDSQSEEVLSEFIHNSQVLLLQVYNENETKVIFTATVGNRKSIVFYKLAPQALNHEKSINNINILTLSEVAPQSLYQILRHIYAPLLTMENNVFSNKIKQNLSEIESDLRILAHGKNEDNFNVILTIEDEIAYWMSLSHRHDINKKERESANTFKELFEEINEELQSMQSVPLSDVRELTENVSGLLDDIWRYSVSSYPQKRMEHVFDIIGYTLVIFLQKTLSTVQIWHVNNDSSDDYVLTCLSECLSAMHMWTNACESLTATYWPNLALHSWNGDPYVPRICLQFQGRLNEVYQIRSTHNQLNKLLTTVEKAELKTSEMFEPFKKINIWINTSNLQQSWESAVIIFSRNLNPAENKIAAKLKPRLYSTSTKQMLYEFMRYKTLINRPSVKQALQKELEAFLASLESFLKTIQIQIESEDAEDVKMYRPPEMSYTVQKVQWAKQMEYKVKDIRECAEKYLTEFEGSQRVLNISTKILDQLKNLCAQVHEDWSRDLQAQVKDGSLKLSLTKPVVEFSPSNQMMVVHFNPRLVGIELEARGMTALGYPPPAIVKEAIDNLSRFLTHARCLQQIASFHNTIGERMIPSTRPMVLQAALDLSALVQEQRAVYWSNIEQVVHYSEMLKKAVTKLESQNSYLTSQHVAIRKVVETLLDTDLLAKQAEWKKKVKEIRDIIEKVEAEGYKNTELWRSHWDWQLYKVLECQYIKTLLSLHKHFPHVRVDLVLRGRSVCLLPPMEEIRAQHYHQLRRLISVPAQFVGLQTNIGDTKSIFEDIIEKHGWLGNKSVRQLENTLNSVEQVCKEWTRRSALACVDLETLCREKLREPQDWELNFKACKAYGQAVAKMSFEDEKIEWISVGTLTLRREFEAQVRNFWSCLISSLQMSCRDDAMLVDSFVVNATLILENKILPKSTRELSEISTKQQMLQEKMTEMEKTVENLKRKSHMLRTWAGDQSVDSTIKEWQKIHELIAGQQQLFEHQAEIVKSSLNGEWCNLNTSIETFTSRWTQGRLRFEEKRTSGFAEILERCQQVIEGHKQWVQLVQDRDELLKECQKFNLKLDFSDAWEQSEIMVNEDFKLWSIFEEYYADYQSLAEQEWIVFQKKLHLIDEFITKWKPRLEPYTAVTLFIEQELDKYLDMTSLLKYLRGTDFTERHWTEVFNILDMEYKKPDTLLLSDFLRVSTNVKKHIKILQKIAASAASESAIRGALNELELWFAGARLSITHYKDKAGQKTPVVRDFKDIISKIEEQQWIVGSARGADSDGTSGADACAMWETRLRAACELVRATHHAQRSCVRWRSERRGGGGVAGALCAAVRVGAGQSARESAGGSSVVSPVRGYLVAMRVHALFTYAILAYALYILAILVSNADAIYNRERDRMRTDPRVLDRACELSSCYPATGNLLIGRESRLFASSTCGVDKPQLYCIVSHLEERKKCFWCDSTNRTINNPMLNHRIQNIIYKYHPGTRNKSWWQSENGKEKVTVQLDMEAEFHLTHLIIEFKTFRPAAMLVERSFDFGKTWRVYRYFAYNCNEAFPGVPTNTQRSLTEVVCESKYSGVAPSTEGEVIFRVLPPNINVSNPYSEEVQNLLRMTNLRINFTKLHTLGDDLLDNRAEIQEKYYYAIYEMTVRGSCSCYGHASRCLPMPGVESKNNMVHGRCECTHNTRGLNCEYCEDFFNDLPWQPAVGKTSNACKRCTCNNHATSCHFDYAVYNLTGKVSGGVCDDCQHNTMGRNCELCKPFYYQDPNLDIQSPDICKPCDCDPVGSLDEGNCDSYTDIATDLQAGRCHCKRNIGGKRCDSCKDGFWNFDLNNPDGCQACTCDPLGTIKDRGCDPNTGECICKRYVTGRNCDQCLPQFYGLSDSDDGCLPCDCDIGGSLDNYCDVITGQCKCRLNLSGRRCDQASQKYFTSALDFMVYEAELSQCDAQIDDNAIQSQMCQIVIREPFRDGTKETWTGPGLMRVPEGTTIVFVIDDIRTSMNYNILIRYEPQSGVNWEEAKIFIKRPTGIDFDSPCANIRPEDDIIHTSLPANQRSVLVKSPICLEREKKYEVRIFLGRQDRRISNPRATVLIDSIVLLPSLDDLPIFGNDTTQNLMREEFERYNCGDSYYYDLHRANVPEVCRKYHASIGFYVSNGAIACHCDMTGSKSHQCETYGGQCDCKPNVVGRRCDRCAPGTYGIGFDGCKACDCNNIGALDNICDASSGQCKCRADTYDRQCDKCQPGYFNFPNCLQCDCNGHADICEDKTGACINCRDYSEGHRCERCTKGYYGDPRLGVDIPCRPCPCPRISIHGNESFAESCDLDPETKDVVCECAIGYAGTRCDVCDDNYFGHPEFPGGSCTPCDCNDNIDLTKPGNCDSHTGKCLQCLHDTAGDHCEVCKEGYYRNFTTNQCLKCECSELGTNFTKGNCDSLTGRCHCYDNVIGDKCDKCSENHWRIALGKGCDPCECDAVGSISPQCNPYIGKCECKEGFGGRQCDQCQENFWGNPRVECYPCQCDLYGSVSQQCLRENGSCVCRPGMGGAKCDMCARGYLGRAPNCYACGECFDNWDNIINGLKQQTQQSINNASQIRIVGATGAYTRDFEEMTRKITEIDDLIHSASAGEITVKELVSNVSILQDKLVVAEQKVKGSNKNLSDITSKIDLGIVALDGLRNNIENLKQKTTDLSNNATTLQEANLEGALNLTREAKQRADAAVYDAENVQGVVSETNRQIKNTDKLIEMQYATFNNTQNENEKKLTDLQEQLTQLENEIPKLNEYLCGQNSDTCDVCGGAGCGKCGGISCEQGAMTKVEQALDFANKTEHKIKEHELTAEDLFRSVSQAKKETVAARDKAKEVFTKANEFKTTTERVTNETLNLTSEIKEFLSNTTTTPTDIRTLAEEILNSSISLKPEEITDLSQRINATVSQLTNIENIIAETKPDLDRAKSLNLNATAALDSSNITLQMANTVLQALDDAQSAQDAAENAIIEANNDIEAAKNDLTPIAKETQEAQTKANTTKEEVEALRQRLGNLQKNILKIETDAQQIKQEANDVVNRAENAEQEARKLRQSFKTANASLADRASQTLNSRERAQLLLNRATKLASDTQEQLTVLQSMEELYNSHTSQLATLEKEIGQLNDQMTLYLSDITSKSNYYRSCTT